MRVGLGNGSVLPSMVIWRFATMLGRRICVYVSALYGKRQIPCRPSFRIYLEFIVTFFGAFNYNSNYSYHRAVLYLSITAYPCHQWAALLSERVLSTHNSVMLWFSRLLWLRTYLPNAAESVGATRNPTSKTHFSPRKKYPLVFYLNLYEWNGFGITTVWSFL